MTTPPRAVVLVGNPVAPYSRALRIARSLVAAGFAVEIAAVAAPGLPAHETIGPIDIRRYAPAGPWRRLTGAGTPLAGGTPSSDRQLDEAAARGDPAVPRRVARRIMRFAAALRRWLLWPHSVRAWWWALQRQLPPADLYHACGSLAIAPALAMRRRSRLGPSGTPAAVIYDAIDDVLESNNVLDMPRLILAWHMRRERRWAREADARTTVNAALAARLATRWRVSTPVVLPNYPDMPAGLDAGAPPDLIRREIGLPPETRIVLFQGRLGPRLGIEAAADAVLMVPDSALVLIGFGRGFVAARARDADPAYVGRHYTLPARHPDELLAWTASADVMIVPLPPVSVNQRLSSPNKFWEAMAAGLPVVIAPGLEVMEPIVREYRLGEVAPSPDAAGLAGALRAVLDRPPRLRQEERRRIAELARERFSWPVASGRYLDLVRDLRAGGTR